jgi:osmotically-inducible protein OsmY
MRQILIVVLLALGASALQGCATAIVGGAATGAAVIHDRRSAGTVIDDQAIELKISSAISNDGNLAGHGHVSATSYNYVVLLTGQAESDHYRNRYYEVASRIHNVKKVINEIQIGPSATLSERSVDSYTTTKAKLALTQIKLADFDPSRIKVVTEKGVVYLLGLVNQQEANAAVEKIRYLRGVKQVVKVFEYF